MFSFGGLGDAGMDAYRGAFRDAYNSSLASYGGVSIGGMNPCLPHLSTIPLPCVSQCTEEQFREVGYRPPPTVYPLYPIDHNPERRIHIGPVPVYKPNIIIRCLEPPPIEPDTRTIVEVRPPTPPAPPPIVTHGPWPGPPPTLPPLILRQRPPPRPAPTNDIHYLRLPTPPAPPAQRIHHIYRPCPPKPRDIIIERWRHHKRSFPRKVDVVPAPPHNPIPVRDVIIEHVHPEPLIEHQIRKYPQPIPTNPETYEQPHDGTLLDDKKLQEILFSILSRQHVSPHILQRLQAIFRVPCDQNNEPIGFDGFMPRPNIDNMIPPTETHFPFINPMSSFSDELLPTAPLPY
ncbi:unnamed protein product [Rotaria sordida]|uniref:Uncharacterized protein n=1 Tax=Rotaria sordida TaxID=392033 RepID=A0A819ID44_9BILA|nr:unnamed protein product [Rotaria sordida]